MNKDPTSSVKKRAVCDVNGGCSSGSAAVSQENASVVHKHAKKGPKSKKKRKYPTSKELNMALKRDQMLREGKDQGSTLPAPVVNVEKWLLSRDK